MYINSNMTNIEAFKLYGTLPADRIESILEAETQLSELQGIEGNLIDANSFPAEDFLAEVISDLQTLKRGMRGNNRENLDAIIEKLEDIAQCTFNASEHGRSELQAALKAIQS